MRIRFITDCVIGQTEFAEGQVYDQDDAAARAALQLGRAVEVTDGAQPAAVEPDEGDRESE